MIVLSVVKTLALHMQVFDVIRFSVGVVFIIVSTIMTAAGLHVDTVKAVWFEVPTPAFVGVLLVLFPLILAAIRAWKGKKGE